MAALQVLAVVVVVVVGPAICTTTASWKGA
jgi:hypothetical protein